MPAVNYNFDIEKGSDFNITFLYNGTDGNAVDLRDKCVLFSLVSENRITITGYNSNSGIRTAASLTADEAGRVSLNISGSETNKFNFSSALYDLDIRDGSGFSNTRISTGIINLITRNSPLNIDPNNGAIICDVLPPPPTGETPPNSGETPTPTGTVTPTPTPVPVDQADFCLPYDCGPIDLFSTVYNGSGLVLNDLSTTSGSVIVSNTGIISNVELAINKLSHNNPADLVFLLAPPSGNKILLSANSKITNFNNNFSFVFSNKASSGIYPYNVPNGQVCNILDKTNVFKYNNENLLSSFSGLFGSSVTGVWNFIVSDTDPLGSGLIDSWKLIITYDNNIPENTEPF